MAPPPPAPWFRHHPTPAAPAPPRSSRSCLPRSQSTECSLPRRAPAEGPAREEGTHLFCVNFPSLSSLLFSEFTQSKPSHGEQRVGTSFSSWIASFPKDLFLRLRKRPYPVQMSYLHPQPARDVFPGKGSAAMRGRAALPTRGPAPGSFLRGGFGGEGAGDTQQPPQHGQKPGWAFPTRSPFVRSRQRSIWF